MLKANICMQSWASQVFVIFKGQLTFRILQMKINYLMSIYLFTYLYCLLCFLVQFKPGVAYAHIQFSGTSSDVCGRQIICAKTNR